LVTLQRRFAYRYKSKQGTKEHYKYIMTIPEEIVEELDWKPGDDLQPIVRDHALIVESASTSGNSRRRQKDT
jgi:bifunctional DNA-binding transcriptional regulator/antitoxin component of YhaV-PrlF toxin-antitoxin module